MQDVAVFIDWQNLFISCERQLGEKPQLWRLREAAENFGRVTIMRAYGEFDELRGALETEGVEPVVVTESRKADGTAVKNAADVHMVVDTMEAIQQFSSISTIILITGDQDFIPLVKSLRRSGKNTVLIGPPGSTATKLSNAVDVNLPYTQCIMESVIEESEEGEEEIQQSTLPVYSEPDMGGDDSEKLQSQLDTLIAATIEALKPVTEPIEGSKFLKLLEEEIGFFDYEDYGVEKLRDLARLLEKNKALTIESGQINLHVRPYGSVSEISDEKRVSEGVSLGSLIELPLGSDAVGQDIDEAIGLVLGTLPESWTHVVWANLRKRTQKTLHGKGLTAGDSVVDKRIETLKKEGKIIYEQFLFKEINENRSGFRRTDREVDVITVDA